MSNKPLIFSKTAPKDRKILENRANFGLEHTKGYKTENKNKQKEFVGDDSALRFVRGGIGDELHHIVPLQTISLILDHAKNPEDLARLNKFFRDELELNVSSNPKGTMHISKTLHNDVHRKYKEFGVQPSANNQYIQHMGINKLLTGELKNPTYDELLSIAREYMPYAKEQAHAIFNDAYERQDKWSRALTTGRKMRSMNETEGMEEEAQKFANEKLDHLLSLLKEEDRANKINIRDYADIGTINM